MKTLPNADLARISNSGSKTITSNIDSPTNNNDKIINNNISKAIFSNIDTINANKNNINNSSKSSRSSSSSSCSNNANISMSSIVARRLDAEGVGYIFLSLTTNDSVNIITIKNKDNNTNNSSSGNNASKIIISVSTTVARRVDAEDVGYMFLSLALLGLIHLGLYLLEDDPEAGHGDVTRDNRSLFTWPRDRRVHRRPR